MMSSASCRLAEIERADAALVQQAVHRDEGFAAGESFAGERPVGGEAAVQAEGDEERLAGCIPVREPAGVLFHDEKVSLQIGSSQEN